MVGLTAGCEHTVLRGDLAARAFSVFCFNGDRLIGIESVNRAADHMFGRRLIASGQSILPEEAADPDFDFKARLAALPRPAAAAPAEIGVAPPPRLVLAPVRPAMQLFTTSEAARYLRLKERKIYEMVAEGTMPCTKVTGRWLFPKAELDHWLAASISRPAGLSRPEPAPIVAGSHDPLLEWALRESGCGLATLAVGSEAGLARFIAGEAIAAAMHLHALDDPDADANVAALTRARRRAGRGDDRLLPPRAGLPGAVGQSAEDQRRSTT